jgi:uncharacterized protein
MRYRMTQTPEFIYQLRPTRLAMLTEGPMAEEEAAVDRHFSYLEELTSRGVVLLAGRTIDAGPETVGLVVFRAQDLEEARSIMNGDPAVVAGVMSATLQCFRVALMQSPGRGVPG